MNDTRDLSGDEPEETLRFSTLEDDLREHAAHDLDPAYDEEPPARRAHVGYLLSALFFLGVAGLWAVGQLLIVDVDDAALLAAGTLIGVGTLTLVIWWASALRR